MLGSLTTPSRPAARDDATSRVAFQVGNPVGARDKALSRLNGQPRLDPLRGSSPCRRFALPLTEHDARLGGDVIPTAESPDSQRRDKTLSYQRHARPVKSRDFRPLV